MSVNDISILFKPPEVPHEQANNKQWPEILQQLGTELPTDYKDFLTLYGSGKIDNFLCVLNPFSQNENQNLEKQLQTQLAVLSELQTCGEILPYKFFPNVGGILPFAITDNGDVLFWHTVGMADEWTVVVNEARSLEWEAFPMSMSEFLANVLNRQIRPAAFPKAFPNSLIFTPTY